MLAMGVRRSNTRKCVTPLPPGVELRVQIHPQTPRILGDAAGITTTIRQPLTKRELGIAVHALLQVRGG